MVKFAKTIVIFQINIPQVYQNEKLYAKTKKFYD